MTDPTAPPPIERILETALYVESLERSRDFYVNVLGLTPMTQTPRLCSLAVGDQSVLLLFPRSMPTGPLEIDIGTIPGHGAAAGVQHFAFAIDARHLNPWVDRLTASGIAIESRVTWDRGGTSVYFRDPDGHSIELLTPGLWPIY